ncbi:kinase-like domain-containing protein [Phaeosphaeriaceae sp. PMI808]|nr:kinase-like domain-containing protein [Phaeosphaeriaceae sp. PMI808]
MLIEQPQAESVLCPDIRSKRDLTTLSEVTDYETSKFLRSTFTYVNKEGIAWFGRVPGIRKYDLSVEDLKRELRRIPDEKIYPLHTWMSVVPEVDQKNLFIKRPKISCADNEYEVKLVPQMLFEEAEILEFLKQHHHPNIVNYHGCTVNRGYITGLALERYEVILQYRYEDVPHDLDIAACMNGIRAGVRHLHSLGLAHNDLNPTNIALDNNDNPIILDFGSCKKFGEELLSGGTYGWIDEDYSTSAPRHDKSAMDKIEAWLVEEKNNSA